MAYLKAQMDLEIHHVTANIWAATNEISWLGPLGLREIGLEERPVMRFFFEVDSCDPAGLLQSPKTPEPRKYEIPHPGLATENTKRIPKKYKNDPKNCRFGSFLYFFGIFFIFSGAKLVWGILNFFRIFGVLGFLGCSRPAGSQVDSYNLLEFF